jgi:hypothetical protein
MPAITGTYGAGKGDEQAVPGTTDIRGGSERGGCAPAGPVISAHKIPRVTDWVTEVRSGIFQKTLHNRSQRSGRLFH